jgi:hypothetical protein
MNRREKFYQNECLELLAHNQQAALNFSLVQRNLNDKPRRIVLTCMDERTALVEEALNQQPALIQRIATGGGKIEADYLLALIAGKSSTDKKDVTLYLVTHEVIGRPELGCAAFKNDIRAQEKYFSNLKTELLAQCPQARIHILSLDTSTGGLRAINLDDRDDDFASFVRRGGQAHERATDENHAGYGIYVGEAFRAWCSRRNTYFHISVSALSLGSDLNIALEVMSHHSDVSLENKPIILQIDEPLSWEGLPADCADRSKQTITAWLAQSNIRDLLSAKKLRVINTKTDLTNWHGQIPKL